MGQKRRPLRLFKVEMDGILPHFCSKQDLGRTLISPAPSHVPNIGFGRPSKKLKSAFPHLI